MQNTAEKPMRWLTMKEVMERTGYKRTKIYELRLEDSTFPKPIKLGKGVGRHATLRWIESDIDAWMEQQVTNG